MLNTLLPTNPGLWVLDGIMIFVLMSTFVGIGKFNLTLSILFLLMTILIGWTNQIDWKETIHGFSYMVKLLLFICFVPIIAMPIQGFIPNIQRLIRVASRKISPRNVCNYAAFLLANVTNLASLPICKSIFSSDKDNKETDLSYSIIIVRSFGIAMVCTPLGAAVAVSIDMAETNILSLIGVNAVLVVIGLTITTIFEARGSSGRSTEKDEIEENFQKEDLLFLAKMLIPILIYFVILTIVDGNSPLGMMELIVLSILPFSFIWSMGLGKIDAWRFGLTDLVKNRAPNMFNQFSVIISAGLTIFTIEIVGLDYQILRFLPGVDSDYAYIWYIPIIIVTIFLLAIVGVHQFVALVFVGELIEPAILGMEPVIFAGTLLVGFSSGMISSSFSGTNILMSNLTPPMSSYDIAKRNYSFTVIFIGGSVLYLMIMNYILVGLG